MSAEARIQHNRYAMAALRGPGWGMGAARHAAAGSVQYVVQRAMGHAVFRVGGMAQGSGLHRAEGRTMNGRTVLIRGYDEETGRFVDDAGKGEEPTLKRL